MNAISKLFSSKNKTDNRNESRHVTQRSDWCPYLGHVPYFAPKRTKSRAQGLGSRQVAGVPGVSGSSAQRPRTRS